MANGEKWEKNRTLGTNRKEENTKKKTEDQIYSLFKNF